MVAEFIMGTRLIGRGLPHNRERDICARGEGRIILYLGTRSSYLRCARDDVNAIYADLPIRCVDLDRCIPYTICIIIRP